MTRVAQPGSAYLNTQLEADGGSGSDSDRRPTTSVITVLSPGRMPSSPCSPHSPLVLQIQMYNQWDKVHTMEYAEQLVSDLSAPTAIHSGPTSFTLTIPPSKLVLG